MMEKIENFWQNAIVIQADSRELKPGENFYYPQVQSCYLTCCLTGKGKIIVNNLEIDVIPGTVIFAPWNHTITYIPDGEEPFVGSGVHIIPDTSEHGNIIYNAFHSAQSDHPLYLMRHNEAVENFNHVTVRHYHSDSHMINLIRYAADCYLKGAGETQLRLLARLLFFEIYKMVNSPEDMNVYPQKLQKFLDLVDDNLELPQIMSALTVSCDISKAGIERLFRRYMNSSPHKYIIRRKLKYAAKLLRETSISITGIAARLQFSTQGNFSRAFKNEFGISPRQYREKPLPGNHDFILKRPPRQRDPKMKTTFHPRFISENK